MWRTIDAKGLYAATVAISETYDVLVADKIAAATGAGWSVRNRHERSALFEIDGVAPELLAEFSQRSLQVAATLRELLTDFPRPQQPVPDPCGDVADPPARHPAVPAGQAAAAAAGVACSLA